MNKKERAELAISYEESKKRVMAVLDCTEKEYEKMADYGYIDHFGLDHCKTKEDFKSHMTEMIAEEEMMEMEMEGEKLWKSGDKNILLNFLWK